MFNSTLASNSSLQLLAAVFSDMGVVYHNGKKINILERADKWETPRDLNNDHCSVQAHEEGEVRGVLHCTKVNDDNPREEC